MPENKIKCELMIIGSGIAGMAASLFAAENGIKAVQVGMAGELTFASGLIDLMGVYPFTDGTVRDNPFEALADVARDIPAHPLAKITPEDINISIDKVLTFLTAGGLTYHRDKEKNHLMITGIGTVKPSHCIPSAMMAGVKAYRDKTPCLVIDIHGMKGFSARQISETLKAEWPEISYETVVFPDTHGEVFGENIAFSIENPEILKKFAENIIPRIKHNKVVGLPAILGIGKSETVRGNLEKMLGVPVFEIPGLPPSVPGIRIKSVFESELPKRGIALLSQKKVIDVQIKDGGGFQFTIGNGDGSQSELIEADAAVLATGRFLGKGLAADYSTIRESLFDLPVHQPENRRQWHSRDFFDRNGHQVNAAGVETDDLFRPIDSDGNPVVQNLYAAGSVLAHNDWKRMKSGAGVSIASAYAAVKSYLAFKG